MEVRAWMSDNIPWTKYWRHWSAITKRPQVSGVSIGWEKSPVDSLMQLNPAVLFVPVLSTQIACLLATHRKLGANIGLTCSLSTTKVYTEQGCISNKTTYCKILKGDEAPILVFRDVGSLWYLRTIFLSVPVKYQSSMITYITNCKTSKIYATSW